MNASQYQCILDLTETEKKKVLYSVVLMKWNDSGWVVYFKQKRIKKKKIWAEFKTYWAVNCLVLELVLRFWLECRGAGQCAGCHSDLKHKAWLFPLSLLIWFAFNWNSQTVLIEFCEKNQGMSPMIFFCRLFIFSVIMCIFFPPC